jgi:hypothetical protein
MSVGSLALLAAVVFGVNLLPAFGPPTWAVLVFFHLNSHIPAVTLVALGAVSAATGRLVLANASGRFRTHLSERRLASLESARAALTGSPRRAFAGLALFAISPIPSAQLFVAAGLLRVRIVPLTGAFFAGRLVSYSIYVSAAGFARKSLGSSLTAAFSTPWGIALEVALLAGLVALIRVDWGQLLTRGGHPDAAHP